MSPALKFPPSTPPPRVTRPTGARDADDRDCRDDGWGGSRHSGEARRHVGSDQALRDAIKRYNAEGVEGLHDRPRAGRPTKPHSAGARIEPAESEAEPLEERYRRCRGFKKGLRTFCGNSSVSVLISGLRIFFQDEARIGQKGRVCHRWYGKGQRPPGTGYQRFTFAASEVRTDNAFALIPAGGAMQEFFDRFAETIPETDHVALFLDRAGWHGSTR
jgi:hypothetical protein